MSGTEMLIDVMSKFGELGEPVAVMVVWTDPSPATSKRPKLVQMPPTRTTSPLLPSADSPNFAAALRMSSIYLNATLPKGSSALFSSRKYGQHLGVPIVCPHCEERPPHHIKPWNRWRWMTFHLATMHKGKA